MAVDATPTVDAQDTEVMASVDSSELVLADVTRDDAWITVSLDAATPLRAWR
ncbi:hypothetical protein ACFQJD_16000 [Haloplanus sp. GCM10025708]|uniref:DUF7556 family protein n=1 Tax=Haloferacaceae TaxID=1644056 RepID=UPI00360964AE